MGINRKRNKQEHSSIANSSGTTVLRDNIKEDNTNKEPGGTTVLDNKEPGGTTVLDNKEPGGTTVLNNTKDENTNKEPGGTTVLNNKEPGGTTVLNNKEQRGTTVLNNTKDENTNKEQSGTTVLNNTKDENTNKEQSGTTVLNNTKDENTNKEQSGTTVLDNKEPNGTTVLNNKEPGGTTVLNNKEPGGTTVLNNKEQRGTTVLNKLKEDNTNKEQSGTTVLNKSKEDFKNQKKDCIYNLVTILNNVKYIKSNDVIESVEHNTNVLDEQEFNELGLSKKVTSYLDDEIERSKKEGVEKDREKLKEQLLHGNITNYDNTDTALLYYEKYKKGNTEGQDYNKNTEDNKEKKSVKTYKNTTISPASIKSQQKIKEDQEKVEYNKRSINGKVHDRKGQTVVVNSDNINNYDFAEEPTNNKVRTNSDKVKKIKFYFIVLSIIVILGILLVVL